MKIKKTKDTAVTHGPQDEVVAPAAADPVEKQETAHQNTYYTSDNFKVFINERGHAEVSLAGWVGPTSLVFPADQLKELSKLLSSAS